VQRTSFFNQQLGYFGKFAQWDRLDQERVGAGRCRRCALI
jgi:hypothetical protein